jgi:hypothetical protein
MRRKGTTMLLHEQDTEQETRVQAPRPDTVSISRSTLKMVAIAAVCSFVALAGAVALSSSVSLPGCLVP